MSDSYTCTGDECGGHGRVSRHGALCDQCDPRCKDCDEPLGETEEADRAINSGKRQRCLRCQSDPYAPWNLPKFAE